MKPSLPQSFFVKHREEYASEVDTFSGTKKSINLDSESKTTVVTSYSILQCWSISEWAISRPGRAAAVDCPIFSRKHQWRTQLGGARISEQQLMYWRPRSQLLYCTESYNNRLHRSIITVFCQFYGVRLVSCLLLYFLIISVFFPLFCLISFASHSLVTSFWLLDCAWFFGLVLSFFLNRNFTTRRRTTDGTTYSKAQ